MKTLAIVGALLIALGLAGLVWGGVTYTKSKDTAKLGPIDITVKEKKTVPVPMPVSVVAVVGGVVLLVMGTRRRPTG
ncbi:MAG: hypothetical protein ACM3PF_07265 [Bacteroidota bacterium]